MYSLEIRQMIGNALMHDGYTGSLAHALMQRASLHGQWPDPLRISRQVMFVRSYVQRVPELLDATYAGARRAGCLQRVSPLLQRAENYFVSPVDVIPDHLGLVGITDDAYLVCGLLQMISERHRSATGQPLLPCDLRDDNEAMGELIGEPQLSQLNALLHSAMQELTADLNALESYAESLPTEDEPWLSDPALAPDDAKFLSTMHGLSSRRDDREPRHDMGRAGPPGGDMAPSGDADWRGDARQTLSALMDEYREQSASGKISGTRQHTLEPVLKQIRQLLDSRPESLDDHVSQPQRIRDLMAQMGNVIGNPSYGSDAAPEDSRAARVEALLKQLKLYLFAEAQRPGIRDDEHHSLQDLYLRCARAGTALQGVGNDEEASLALEAESLRQLALEIRWYAVREHPMLATPIWSTPAESQNPNAIFYSGGGEWQRDLRTACDARRLQLLASVEHRNYALARWNQLRSASIAVFDLAQSPGGDRAASCYELGIALALGRPIIILAQPETDLPFDVSVEALRLNGNDRASRLGDAIDDVMFGRQFGGADSSVRETIAYTRSLGAAAPRLAVMLNHFDDEALDDPVKLRTWLGTILGLLGPEGPQLLYPAWPGGYPNDALPCCFHVMPFREAWSDSVRDLVSATCGTKLKYVRGDQVKDPRIIRSIWDLICGATHVLADITGQNDNVMLELGMAHALGRNTLIVSQEETLDDLVPSIGKLRVHTYTQDGDARTLREIVTEFFDSGG